MRRGFRYLPIGALLGGLAVAATSANETIVYRYDELGRLERVERSGTANNGVSSDYAYDPADNRAWIGVGGANPAAAATVAGGGFEAPDTSNYIYRPAANFTGNSGLAANNGAWGFFPAPEGDQAAFIQGGDPAASIALQVAGMSPGKAYSVRFFLASRPGYSGNPVTVSLNGLPLGTFDPPTDRFTGATSVAFTAPASHATLTFTGHVGSVNLATGIDAVTVSPAAPVHP
jgi:hypothetical protein